MPRQAKKPFYVKLLVDDREKNNWANKIKLDKQLGNDKVWIKEIETKRLKTGDTEVWIKRDLDGEYEKIPLLIENKVGSDIFSTIVSNWARFKDELKRADGQVLYIIHNWSFNDIKTQIKSLQKMRRIGYKTNYFKVFIDRYLEINENAILIYCEEENYNELIRRIIKKYLKKVK